MEFDRYSGKTLDEALAAACSAKNAAVEELTYTVVEEKAGFLGLGRTVTIEAWAPVDIIVFLNDYIRTYFENAEMDGSVSIELDEDDFYRIQVDTNCNAVLIGRQGRTLQDFNRLVRAAASAVFLSLIHI